MSKTPTAAMTAALAQAAIIRERGIDAVPHDPRAEPGIHRGLNWLVDQKQLGRTGQKRKGVCTIFNFGPSKELQAEAAGELESYLDGTIRIIPNESVCRRMIALALLAYPLDGPEPKARQSESRYRAAPRPRTPRELEGLKRGNAKRAADAQQRREAKEARA
jgi:hypothetical protein